MFVLPQNQSFLTVNSQAMSTSLSVIYHVVIYGLGNMTTVNHRFFYSTINTNSWAIYFISHTNTHIHRWQIGYKRVKEATKLKVPSHPRCLDIKRTWQQRLENSLEDQGRWGSGLGKSGSTATEWTSANNRHYAELKTWNTLAFSAHQSWDACTVPDSWMTYQWEPVLDVSPSMGEEVVSTPGRCSIST